MKAKSNTTLNDMKKRVTGISYRLKLSHLGSVLTALPIIDEIYKTKKPDEKFVLSCGHAGLALYVVIEKYFGIDAEKIFNHHGVHPDYCEECHIDCSSGSLGNGLPIAVGMALSDRSRNIYCLISDGEMAEGVCWEALRIAKEQKLTNLKIYCNANGWGGYRSIDVDDLEKRIQAFGFPVKIYRTNMNEYSSWLQEQAAHYVTMNEDQYREVMGILK